MKPSRTTQPYAIERRQACRTWRREAEKTACVLPSLLYCYVPGIEAMPQARLTHRFIKYLNISRMFSKLLW